MPEDPDELPPEELPPSGLGSGLLVAACTAPTTAPAVAATALVTVSATLATRSPMVDAPSRTCSAIWLAAAGARLAFFTTVRAAFFTAAPPREANRLARLAIPAAPVRLDAPLRFDDFLADRAAFEAFFFPCAFDDLP